MAGSRLEKFGTIYTRVRDLLRSGIIKQSDKPIWYDVYKAFPPKRNPLYVKTSTKSFNMNYGKREREDAVPDIFYKEDLVRAKFYEVYATGPRPLDLSRLNFVSTCQRFVERYTELERSGSLEESSLFEETAKALLAEGVVLRRGKRERGPAVTVAAESRDPVLGVKLADILEEQHGASSAEKQDSEVHTARTSPQ